jgi:predicted acetyltransferase
MMLEETLPPGVEVVHATAEEEPVLANLLELYAHDFSAILDLQLAPDGRFGYTGLARYWREEGRFPFLVRVDGNLAGFALVSRGSRVSADPGVWDMAEFFVVRRYRSRGIGAAVAREIWRRFPGTWEIRVLEANRAARAFWRATVGGFTARGADTRATLEEKPWQVFSFASPAELAPEMESQWESEPARGSEVQADAEGDAVAESGAGAGAQ